MAAPAGRRSKALRQNLLALAFLLQGCASSTPLLYTLRQEPGPVHNGMPLVVTVRSFGVPRYLERSEIVRDTTPGRLVASDNDWWAEPLRSMLSRVMVDDLEQRLPQTVVLLAGGTIPGPPGAEIQVELQRFERDNTGPVILTGTVAIEAAGHPRRIDRLDIRVPVAGVMVADQVAAMSSALARVADLVATRIVP